MPELTFNLELSKQLAKKVRAKQGQCYYNSWKAFEELRDKPETESLYYCEGWALSGTSLGDIAIDHGWLEVNGQIVDVSWWKNPSPIYLTTLRLDTKARWEAMQRAEGVLPLVEGYTWRGVYDETIATLHANNLTAALKWKRDFNGVAE